MTNVNNNERVSASVQTLNEVNNQTSFERFCKFCEDQSYIQIDIKSPKNEDASFYITVTKENEEREEMRLFLNQEVLGLVMNYLEFGKLENTSKINANDLESFNERGADFKTELFHAERTRGKEVVWSYTLLGKLVSIYYNYGIIVFHPYAASKTTPVSNACQRIGEKVHRLSASWFLEDSFTHKINRSNRIVFLTVSAPCNNSNSATHSQPSRRKENSPTKNELTNPQNEEKIEITKLIESENVKADENVKDVKISSIEQFVKMVARKATSLRTTKKAIHSIFHSRKVKRSN